MAKQAKQREKGNEKQRVDKTVHHREGGVFSNPVYEGPKPLVSDPLFTVYDEKSFRQTSGKLDVNLLTQQSMVNKAVTLRGGHETFVRIGDMDYEVRDGAVYHPFSDRKYEEKTSSKKKPATREQAVKQQLQKTQEVLKSAKSSSAEKKAAAKQGKQLHKEQGVIQKVAKAPPKKQTLKEMFPEKPVSTTSKSLREDIEVAKAQEYNRIINEKLGGLTPDQKKELLSGSRQGKTLQVKIRNGARDLARGRVEKILTGTPLEKTPMTPEIKKIYGAIKEVAGSGDTVKRLRVIPAYNASGVRQANPKTQKVVRENGLNVVKNIGSARAKREAGKERRAKERAVTQRRNARARRKQEALNREKFGTPRPRTKAHYEKIKLKQREVRANDQGLKDTRIAKNREYIQKANQIDAQLKSKGNKKTIRQAAKDAGTTIGGYKRGVYFAGKGTKALGAPLTKAIRKKISDHKLGKFSFPKNRHAPMHHGKTSSSILSNQMQGVSFPKPKKLKVQKLVGFSKLGQRGKNLNLYSTMNTINVPSRNQALAKAGVMRDFKGKGRGVLMSMQLRGLITIDGKNVSDRITQRMIPAVRKGIVAASEKVGRKILDLIEPYVPKDREYMYRSAITNSGQAEGGMISMADGAAFPESERLGVSFSYNTPYAEMVYFDETKAHGAEYNAKHGVQEKGEKETARWIEVALQKEELRLRSLLGDYALSVTTALNSASGAGRMGPH